MMAKDFAFYPAFRGIVDFLRQQNIPVYVTNQDGIGTIAGNAAQLKEEISQILKAENCEKVNIIAHSKGGLDARYMISCLGMASHVATLTTLSTPHHGSRLCAALLKMPLWMAKVISFFTNLCFRILKDKNPDLLALGRELTETAMEDFNRAVPNHPQVYYQSYASGAADKKAFLLFIPYELSKYCEQGQTDGMVSVASSQWGAFKGRIPEDFDHFQMVGVYGSRRKLINVALFYLHIIQELRDMGY
jgi:triacylglycerol lipase